jgi:rhodanese-related sulfurtransferase
MDMKALLPEAFSRKIQEPDVLVLDTRSAGEFVNGFIPGAVFIGISSPRFGEWAATLIDKSLTLLLVCTQGTESEVCDLLKKAGFPEPEGYLEGGFPSWTAAGKPIDMIIEVEADELAMDIPFDENLLVLDVRNETEYADGHVKDALLMPLEVFNDTANIAMIDENQAVYVHCKSGYRSVIAASLLKREGLHNLRNVAGGWDAIVQESRIKTEKDPKALN